METERIEPIIAVEEGEISEDSEVEAIDYVTYVPLERPTINVVDKTSVRQLELEKISDTDSWSNESDSDSDDNSRNNAKKSKLKIKGRKLARPIHRKKRYDIWSSHIQEDVLAETLIGCDVSRIDRSRNVESYDHFDLRQKLRGNKRTHGGKQKFQSRKRDDSDEEEEEDEIKGSTKLILDLVTTVESADEDLARDIANKLCEEKDDLIVKIVQMVGKKKAIEIFEETKRIEADGGMLIMNQTRRRTPGGVYIFLLKRDDDISRTQIDEIFGEDKRLQRRDVKLRQKEKRNLLKAQIEKKRAEKNKNLPKLLTRAELLAQKAAESTEERHGAGSDPEDIVSNPPPSPVTDCKENSTDGMNDETPPPMNVATHPNRDINSYDDDFLDLGCNVDMDMF